MLLICLKHDEIYWEAFMRFDKEGLFRELVKKYGMNLYLGAGFSVYAYNEEGENLP